MTRPNVRSTSKFPKRTGWKSSRGVMVRDARARVAPYRPPAKEGELKWVDTSNAQDIDTTSSFVLLNGTTRGSDAEAQRIGRNIKLKSVQWNYRIRPDGTNGLVFNAIRFMIVYDRDPNGVLPSVSDLLVSSGDPCSLLNMANKDRFIVLHSELFTDFDFAIPGATTPAAPNTACKVFSGYKKLNLKTTYNSGNAGTIADIQHGAVYALAISAAASGYINTESSTFRIRYTDA